MKKSILVLIFVSSVCIANGPKFHFKDCVEVTRGFYKGCKGDVESFDERNPNPNRYEVSLDCKGEGFMSIFEEKDLKPSTGCVK